MILQPHAMLVCLFLSFLFFLFYVSSYLIETQKLKFHNLFFQDLSEIICSTGKFKTAAGLFIQRYITEMTLLEALQGRGDPYRTPLREGTTSLLNSYNSLHFGYDPVTVVAHTNSALLGSQRDALYTPLRFIRANSGSPSAAAASPAVTCRFSPCK